MAKSVADLLDEKKKEQNVKNQYQNQNLTPEQMQAQVLQETQAKLQFSEAQVKVYQEQLQQGQVASEEQKLAEEAKKLKANTAALEQEANLSRTLAEALATEQPNVADETGDLSQKELISVIADAVSKASDANSKLIMNQVEDRVKETGGEISKLQSVMIDLLGSMSVQQARSAHKDFDDYQVEAAKILQKTQGLSPEDAYLLAKAQKASTVPDKKQVESERPTSIPSFTRPTKEQLSNRDADQQHVNPRLAFKNAVSDAVDKVIANRQK